METFTDTDGLIIDLRQYPAHNSITYELAGYLVEEKNKHFATVSRPLQFRPNVFVNLTQVKSGGVNGLGVGTGAYFYENDVVVLMDEGTISAAEFAVMSLLNGSNVTVMGNNSIGADGNIVRLPLPGGITMIFTGLGIYTPEGGQTQRIGISPDIYVYRTIEGIREYIGMFDDSLRLNERIKKAFNGPILREILAIASKDLLEATDKGDLNANSKSSEQILSSLIKYFIRLSTRPTPFGLFSGMGLPESSEYYTCRVF